MKNTITDKWIVEKDDTGDNYHGNRYVEFGEPELPEIGKTYFVIEKSYVGPNRDRTGRNTWLQWIDNESFIAEGFPGNSNKNIKRFHGWRGTTDDISIYAMGVRECIEVTRKEYQKTVHYRIVFGSDIREGEK